MKNDRRYIGEEGTILLHKEKKIGLALPEITSDNNRKRKKKENTLENAEAIDKIAGDIEELNRKLDKIESKSGQEDFKKEIKKLGVDAIAKMWEDRLIKRF